MKDKTLLIIVFILLVISTILFIILGLIMMANFPEPYTLHLDGGKCNIGKPEIAGDFKVAPTNKNPLNFEDFPNCAIKDCAAYNLYQSEINSNMRCVV